MPPISRQSRSGDASAVRSAYRHAAGAGNGNNTPVTAGASLVVVYRLNDAAEPLRKIVFYDGLRVLPNVEARPVQPLHGIYQSAIDAGARLTMIGATSQPNTTDRVRFSNAATGPAGFTAAITDPFPATSNASDRSWSNPPSPGLGDARVPSPEHGRSELRFRRNADCYGGPYEKDAERLHLARRDRHEHRHQRRR